MGARSTHVISCPAMPACYWLIRIKRRSAWPVVSSWGCFSQENQSTRSHCSHRAESAGLQQCRIKVVGFTVFNTELSTTREYTEYIELSTTREVNLLYSVDFWWRRSSSQHVENQGGPVHCSGPPTCLSISPTNIPIVFLGKICS